MIINILFAIAFTATAIYVFLFFRFARKFRATYPDAWRQLDCPETFGIQGQVTYLWLILGREKRVRLSDFCEINGAVVPIRVFLLISFLAFGVVAFMTG